MPVKYTGIKKGVEAREIILRGVNKIVDLVKPTLGADARNVLTDEKGKARVDDDGVSIASGTVLECQYENAAAEAITETAKKTRELAGDGTTTSMVLAGAIINEGLERIKLGGNPMKIKRKIKENCQKVIEKLKEKSRPIKTIEDIQNVAKVALLDEDLGNKIGELAYKIGADGFIGTEENLKKHEHECELTDGMKVDGTYASSIFVTNDRRELITDDCPILVMHGQFERFYDLYYILTVVGAKLNKKRIILIASTFSKEISLEIVNIFNRHKTIVIPLKAPALTEEQLEDIAVFTGGSYFDLNKGDMSKDGEHGTENAPSKKEDYGNVDHLKVDRDFIQIMSTSGNEESIRCRIEMLKEQEKLESDETLKNRIKLRIGAMKAKMGVVKVGSVTEMERKYLFKKARNAVHSSQGAIAEGVVRGGGQALKEIAEELKEENILKKSLQAPYDQQLENSGEETRNIPENILDPLKVERIALENACSIAGMLITTANIRCWKPLRLEEEFRNVLGDQEEFTNYNPQ